MSEVELLLRFEYVNIVKYEGVVCVEECLYIMLEYVENGLLARMVYLSWFGVFLESLCVVYVV